MVNEEELEQLGFGSIIPCAREDCDNLITEKSSWNQKYCSSECTRVETNRRLMEQYYDDKDRRMGKKRICESESCNTVLSRYNESKICSSCEQREHRERNEEFRKMIAEVSIEDGD